MPFKIKNMKINKAGLKHIYKICRKHWRLGEESFLYWRVSFYINTTINKKYFN